jgi:site-specific recombinase XerD
MKSNQKLSILLWVFKAKATKDGRAPIYVRITIEGKDDEISLGRKVDPQFWDNKLKLVTESGMEAKVTNQKVLQIKSDLERHFMVLQTQHEQITSAMLKNVYLGLPVHYDKHSKSEPVAAQSLVPVFADFIKSFTKKVKKGLRSEGTLRQWRSTKKKVESFIAHEFKRNDINLSEIKYSFAESFYEYLTVEIDNPLSEATAKKHIKKTKQILKKCVRKGLIANNPIHDFVCGGDETDVVPLELFEVETIYRKQIDIPRLDQVRDAYIFQCFTGFAFQDLYGLAQDHIVKVGLSAERWLIKDRGKTGVSEMVPILPIVEELIAKYKTDPYCIINNRLIPVNGNARYNGYLKEIAAICGIGRELNTHLARHTFADIMLNNGVPLEDVSKMLGHKSIRTTQRYAKVRKPRISQNMAILKTKLFTESGHLKKVS